MGQSIRGRSFGGYGGKVRKAKRLKDRDNYTRASEVKITKADGTVEIQPALTRYEHEKIVPVALGKKPAKPPRQDG